MKTPWQKSSGVACFYSSAPDSWGLLSPLSDTSLSVAFEKIQGGSCSTENLLFFVSFFEATFDLQPGKGGGDHRVEMISVREIPTLSALTMCFWQRFLKKHSVSIWRMSFYRHDIPERNAQGGLSVSWSSSTSSEVKNMELSVDQIIKDGYKFLDS